MRDEAHKGGPPGCHGNHPASANKRERCLLRDGGSVGRSGGTERKRLQHPVRPEGSTSSEKKDLKKNMTCWKQWEMMMGEFSLYVKHCIMNRRENTADGTGKN